MAAIRKSGGVVTYYYDGKLADPSSTEFCDLLATKRFRSIETAASEEVSVGWVTAADPTGDSFAVEDLDAGTATWLRFRVDKKKLPLKWLQIYRDAAEKQRGKKLSARERRELKDELTERLLPRTLPAVQLVDALVHRDRKLVLLFGGSKALREAFGKLFFETFGLPLELADPLARARQAKLGADTERRIETMAAVRWSHAEGKSAARAKPAAAADEATAPWEDEA